MLSVIFAVDIVINFFVAYWDNRESDWVTSKAAIVEHYVLKTPWFFIDLMSVFPWDAIFRGLLGSDSKYISLLRLIRLVRPPPSAPLPALHVGTKCNIWGRVTCLQAQGPLAPRPPCAPASMLPSCEFRESRRGLM